MGNEGCEEQEPLNTAPEDQRILRKLIEVGKLQAQPMNLPGGGTFDFEFVANAQFFELLTRSDYFVVPYRRTVANGSTTFSVEDENLMTDWQTFGEARAMDSSTDASCLVELPQLTIGGEVRSFEMKSGGGLSIGFGPFGSYETNNIFPSANVKVQNAELEVGVKAIDTLEEVLLAGSTGEATQSRVDLGLNINFGNFSLGPSYYFQSPLADVTRNALTKSLNDVIEKLAEEPWYTRVIEDRDSHLVIGGGNRAGLQRGDILEVYNETHYWSGTPCLSDYRGSISAEQPVAVVKVSQVGPGVALAQVLEQGQMNPAIGAKVVVRKLVEADPKSEDALK